MHTGFRPYAFPWHEAPRGGCFVEEGNVEAVFEGTGGLAVGLDGVAEVRPDVAERPENVENAGVKWL